MRFVLGSVDRTGGEAFELAEVKPHPLYNADTQAFDIALVKLYGEVKTAGVVGISLDFAAPAVGGNITFVGFGDKYADGGVRAMEHTGQPTGHQMTVLGPSHSKCRPKLKKLGLRYPQCSALCVLQVTRGGPCHNDVGGAVLAGAAHALVGVTSQHAGCGKKGKANVVTGLADKQAWLMCTLDGRPDAICASKGMDTDSCVAPGSSAKTCASLGWPVVKRGVCAASEGLAGLGCGQIKTFHEAHGICAALGARLCRVEELLDDVARNTRCQLDRARVWARDPCGFGEDSSEMMTAPGSSQAQRSARPRCTKTEVHSMYGVRCCADEVVDPNVVQRTPPAQRPLSKKGTTMTCAQHGWKSGAGSSQVCGQSKFPLGPKKRPGCPAPMTGRRAQRFCSERGARLCTSAELENDEAYRSGCDLDVKRVWAADACPLGGLVSQAGSAWYLPTHPKVCAPAEEKLPVRCCADTASPAASPLSWFSCQELGWERKDGQAACGHSLKASGCGLPMDYATAATMCHQAGARLCSADELVAGVTEGTGCNLDHKRVWSSSACKNGVYTTSGAKKHSGLIVRKCSPMHHVANVRCCADRDVPGPSDAGFPSMRPEVPPQH